MNVAYSEILRLKALLIFRNAFSKPYEQWTEEESRACALLDAIWRSEHGYAERPNLDDPLHKKAMDSLFRHAGGKPMIKWNEETLRLASGISYEGGETEYRLLSRLYDTICSLWDKFRKKIGFGKKDDISPFEAVRTLKIVNCPEYDSLFLLSNELKRANETSFGDISMKIPEEAYVPDHVRLKYEVALSNIESSLAPLAEKVAEIEKVKNAFATEMTGINPLHPAAFDLIYKNKGTSIIVYARTFLSAIDKPYHQWSKVERDACSVLDAIWRRDRKMEVRIDPNNLSHWNALNKRLSSFSPEEQQKLKEEILKCGKKAVGSEKDEAMAVAYARIGNTCEKYFGHKEFSPFEAMRMLKIVNDPEIGMEHAADEIRNYACGQASGSQARDLSGIPVREGTEKLFGDAPYSVIESPAFADWNKGKDSLGVEPVEIRMTGAKGNVLVRCMSNEKSAIMDAFILAMGHENVTASQCDNIGTGIFRALRTSNGIFDATLKEGEKFLGQAVCRQGERNIVAAQRQNLSTPSAPETTETPAAEETTGKMDPSVDAALAEDIPEGDGDDGEDLPYAAM